MSLKSAHQKRQWGQMSAVMNILIPKVCSLCWGLGNCNPLVQFQCVIWTHLPLSASAVQSQQISHQSVKYVLDPASSAKLLLLWICGFTQPTGEMSGTLSSPQSHLQNKQIKTQGALKSTILMHQLQENVISEKGTK